MNVLVCNVTGRTDADDRSIWDMRRKDAVLECNAMGGGRYRHKSKVKLFMRPWRRPQRRQQRRRAL